MITVGRVLALLLCALLLLRLFTSLDFAPRDENYLYVYVFDVGQSDAILLRTGDKTMLIDTATAAEEDKLRAALLRYDVDKLDYLILTHAHEDHAGNARWLLETLEIETVLLPASDSADYAYGLTLASAAAHATVKKAAAGQCFSLGAAEVEVLLAEEADADGKESDGNNGSTILRVQFGKQVLLFMGDAEKEAEARLLAQYDSAHLDCDFLKVGHHGSSTSTTLQLLATVTPTVAAISCAADNTYGFPHAAVLENLAAAGANVFRTDHHGTLVFGTDGEEIRIIPSDTKGL